MTYETVANGLETLLEGVSGFAAAQVAQADYAVLNKGVTRAIVILDGGNTEERISFGGRFRSTYLFDIQLFARYLNGPADTENQLRDDRELIADRIRKFPKLNATAGVLVANIVGTGPTEMPPGELQASPNAWRMKQILCEVWEEITVTESE